jgi:transcriptional regulator with XRE-family HTH domain
METQTPASLLLGRRVREVRKARGLTLRELGDRVGRPAPYLSQVETGKREPRFSLLEAIAQALGVTTAELVSGQIRDRRAMLEVSLELAQAEPLYRSLALPHLRPSARVPDDVLEHVLTLYRSLASRAELSAASSEGARRANADLRVEMRARDNYYPEIEQAAADVLASVGVTASGAVAERSIIDIAAHFGFQVRRVADIPRQTRSVTDLKHRVIYIPQRNAASTRTARSVILQTLGRLALGQEEPGDFAEYLRQQVEANYFAGAVLAPEATVVPFLEQAKARHDLSIEDLKEVFYISYEMAAHRFTNIATRHLGLRVHFLKSDEQGVVWKAYENDDVPFPVDALGTVEGQRVCRFWGARAAFRSEDAFDIHYQVTETPVGTYWTSTHIEADREPNHAITVGAREGDARFFRGFQTNQRQRSTCPNPQCCQQPAPELSNEWVGMVWPAPAAHQSASMLVAHPVEPIPGVDLTDVLEFLDRRTQ